MAKNEIIILPVGRFVGGSIEKPFDSPDPDKPAKYWFAVAIAKGAETHWAQTAWGEQIWEIGVEAWKKEASTAEFSWKIEDGDTVGRNGYAGCWIVNSHSQYVPNYYNDQVVEFASVEQAMQVIKGGCYVELGVTVIGSNVSKNKMVDKNPSVFINHKHVCFRGYSAQGEIQVRVDPKSLGFGQSAVPADLVATPVANPAMASAVNPPAAPAVPYTPPVASAPAPMPAPHAGILNPPAAPSAPPLPPAATAAPVKRMSPTCPYTYQQLVDSKWSDDQMIAAGHLLP